MKANVYVFFGMIASGKTYLGESFARRHDLAYYNTDRVRKELAGFTPESRQGDDLGKGIYSPEFTQKTYSKMLELAEASIQAGKGVILDGSYSTMVERGRVQVMAQVLDIRPLFVFCGCSENTVRHRLELRAKDHTAVSDGTWDIYQAQKIHFEQPRELSGSELITLDTARDIGLLIEELEKTINDRTA